MTPTQLAHTLQMMDSLFPVGAFSYSDGLESAAASGVARDGDSLEMWLDHFLDMTFVPCDGLALLKSARATEAKDWTAIRSIDEEITALKPAASVRAGSAAVGKRFLAGYSSLFGGGDLLPIISTLPHCNASVAYGIVLSHFGLEHRESLLAYGYSRMSGIVSAAMRLLPIGQQQGQRSLSRALGRLPATVEDVLLSEAEPLRAFSPVMDSIQMNHRFLYSRLFRS
jgi:urease accessory protein